MNKIYLNNLKISEKESDLLKTKMEESNTEELATEFGELLGNYIEDFLHPIYLDRNPLFAAIIKKGKTQLFSTYESSTKLISECYDNLYIHKELIIGKDANFFLNEKIIIFSSVPSNFTISFREMWIEGHNNELTSEEKDMSWDWFGQFFDILEEWQDTLK